eukprot:2164523-Rhodomonas_salina.1
MYVSAGHRLGRYLEGSAELKVVQMPILVGAQLISDRAKDFRCAADHFRQRKRCQISCPIWPKQGPRYSIKNVGPIRKISEQTGTCQYSSGSV